MNILVRIIKIILHIISLIVIFQLFQPIFHWYLSRKPILGVDFYYTATYVSYHLQHFSLTANSFKDIWFAGYPLFDDIFQLHFYFIIPFAKYFGLIDGIRVYIMVSLLLLGVFSYFLYYTLSKNFILSTVLSIAVIYSVNIYGAATWGGSIPYFTTQMFFPLVILFLIKYQLSNNRRWFFLGGLLSGLAALGHALPVYSFIFPAAFFIIFFWLGNSTKYQLLSRLKDFIILIAVTILIALRLLYGTVINALESFLRGDITGIIHSAAGLGSGSSGQGSVNPNSAIADFYRSLAKLLITDTAGILFALVGAGAVFFIISIFFIKQRFEGAYLNGFKKSLGMTLPFILLVVYLAFHVYVNANGHQFLSQGWYRMFWPFPIALGALSAVLWGQFFESFNLRIPVTKNTIIQSTFKFLVVLIISLAISYAGFSFYISESSNTIQKVETKAEYSSAFPEAISIKTDTGSQQELKKSLVPTFMNPDDKNKRLYESDAAVNIWWNSFFQMPLARGYIDPPIGTINRGGFFWLDIAISNDSIVRDFNVPEDIALQNALFLIDWYGIYYFEGGRLSSKGPNAPPSSYLLKNNVFDKEEEVKAYGAIIKYETSSGKPELNMDLAQILHYFKVKDDLTSPILSPNNAPAVIFFSNQPGYEDFLRIIATQNINSRKLIPVWFKQSVDNVSLDQLKQFDAVFLHQYDYHSKSRAFDNLYKYVSDGGKVFIDTGSEVKESDTNKLPKIFPVDSLSRMGMGTEWNIESSKSDLLNDIDVEKFGPLVFNNSEWKVSIPSDQAEIREGSEIILKHKDKPILIKRNIGKGSVIWSGFNLAYHYNQYKSSDEAKLFLNILSEFVDIHDNPVPDSQSQWISQSDVVIQTQQKPKGILFKEEGYDGWDAKVVSSNDKSLPIYMTGPTYPGFIYILTKDLKSQPLTVRFTYRGKAAHWRIELVSYATILLLLEQIIFQGKLLRRIVKPAYKLLRRKIGFWWEREDE